jgi:DNA repair protein RadC
MNQSNLDLNLPKQDVSDSLALSEQPQARLETFGAGALSDMELMALVLQGGLEMPRLMDLSRRLISDAGSIAGLASWHPSDFQRWKGIGPVKQQLLIAVIEIARRMMQSPPTAAPLLNRCDLIAQYFAPIAQGLEVEKFWVLCLNRKNRLKKRVEITSGTATATLAHPREVFRAAIREGSSAIVCVHNHPSGDPAPSGADLQITRQLREAARAVDIDLIDHVIIGRTLCDPTGRGYFSFRESGLL